MEFPAEGTREDVIEYLLRLEMFDEAIVKNKVFLDYYIPMLRADCNMLATYQYRSHERMSSLSYISLSQHSLRPILPLINILSTAGNPG